MTLRLTILGCGSSGGVPRVGQGWGACDPTEPRNRRRRCSILLERDDGADGQTAVLVDTSPDLRDQLLGVALTRLDGIVMTHAHADHTHGIDDVRPLVMMMRRRIAMHMDTATAARVRQAFGYIFETEPGSFYPPLLDDVRMVPARSVRIDGPGGAIEMMPFAVRHGEIDALGLRMGATAYTPDLNAIPDDSVAFVENLDLWIIDALRPSPHPTHFSLQEALAWIDRAKPRRAILTNLHTDMDYRTLKASLPPAVDVAFDGMSMVIG